MSTTGMAVISEAAVLCSHLLQIRRDQSQEDAQQPRELQDSIKRDQDQLNRQLLGDYHEIDQVARSARGHARESLGGQYQGDGAVAGRLLEVVKIMVRY